MIKDITYTLKKGLPNYGSVSFGATATIDKDEDIEKAVAELKDFVMINCDDQVKDAEWIDNKSEQEKEREESNSKMVQQIIESRR
jgi:hypothetical protein